MNRRAGVVQKSGQSYFFGARTAADCCRRFQNAHRTAGARQFDSGGKPVRTRADDGSMLETGTAHIIFAEKGNKVGLTFTMNITKILSVSH
jgi:hypothetical protein